jgi:hypothetical protein
MEVKSSNHQICLTNDNKHIAEINLCYTGIGHVNLQKLKDMLSSNLVIVLPLFREGNMHNVCEACQFGKQARLPFKKESFKSSYALQLIHSDIWGPTKEASIGGNKYYVTFIDDYTRKTWICSMKNKSDVFYHFKSFKNQLENELNAKIKVLRTDGGGEYLSHEFTDYLYDCGIRTQLISSILIVSISESSTSTLYSCRNPFATIRALYLGSEESNTCLTRKTHLHGCAF